MLAELFFLAAGRGHCPNGFHLFAAVGLAHQIVVEGVPALFRFCRPQDGFGGVREAAAAEIRRRVGFFPGDFV